MTDGDKKFLENTAAGLEQAIELVSFRHMPNVPNEKRRIDISVHETRNIVKNLRRIGAAG